jgi:phage terminase large subunit-like protein
VVRRQRASATAQGSSELERAARAARVINFFERVLRHGKGAFSGKLFELLPWQREILTQIFGQVGPDGHRIVREAYVEVPKKNGKSEMAAGIALYMLLLDNERGAEVYSAAAAKDQAALVFRVAAGMVEASPLLSSRLRVIASTKTIVVRQDPQSFYRAISADGDIQDGIEPHCVIIDEEHRWKVQKTMDLHEVLIRGTIARRQPLVFKITTAGVKSESPLAWRDHERARMQEEGVLRDPSFFSRLYRAKKDTPWGSQLARIEANPSHEHWGGFLRDSVLAAECEKAKADPAVAAEYMRYHLNLWGQRENRAISAAVWAENGAALRGLVGRECYIGVDLSSTVDLTAVLAIFPKDGEIDVLPFFFMAEDRVPEREKKDHQPYRSWANSGHLELTEGNIIDYKAVRRKIDWCNEVFDVRMVGVDPRMAADFTAGLINDGFTTIDVSQNFGTLTGPTRRLLELYQAKQLRHANHPLLAWNADCCELKSDGNEGVRFVKPDRAKSNKRIDGMSALVNALHCWIKTGGDKPKTSIWDDPELVKVMG